MPNLRSLNLIYSEFHTKLLKLLEEGIRPILLNNTLLKLIFDANEKPHPQHITYLRRYGCYSR